MSISTQQAPRAAVDADAVARRRRGGRLPGARRRGAGLVHPGDGRPSGQSAVSGRAAAWRGPAVRSGDGPAPAPGVLPPLRCLRPDRVRRVVHGRGLGLRRPDRAAHRAGRTRRPACPALAAADARAGGAPPAVRRPADPRRRPAEHRPSLRPVQRPVRPVPRRDHDLLLGPVRGSGRRHAAGRGAPAGRRPAAQDRLAAGPGRRRAGLPAARDRHRLGRAGHPRARTGAPAWSR